MCSNDMKQQISEALKAHGAWKHRLRRATATGALECPATDVMVDNKCAFGKWLYAAAADREISRSEDYRKVRALHAAFHRAAGDVARKIEQGRTEDAKNALEGASFAQATKDLSAALMDWRRSA